MSGSKENIEYASAPQISMATNKRSAGWREATGDFFYKCYFDISHIQTELSISEPLPTKEHDEAVLRGPICGKYKRNHIFQLPPHQLKMLLSGSELFLKMIPIPGKETEQVVKAVIYICLLNSEALLLFSPSRSFFGQTGFYNPWLSTDGQALPTTDPECGFQVLTHNSLCHHEELAG